jgi:hypothetical protein
MRRPLRQRQPFRIVGIKRLDARRDELNLSGNGVERWAVCLRATRTLEADRVFALRARLRLDISKLLSLLPAQQRAATTQTPRRPIGAGGARGASRSGSVSVHSGTKWRRNRAQEPHEARIIYGIPADRCPPVGDRISLGHALRGQRSINTYCAPTLSAPASQAPGPVGGSPTAPNASIGDPLILSFAKLLDSGRWFDSFQVTR